MDNFKFFNPTKIFFGSESIHYLSGELNEYGENVLLVSGSGSIKKNGIYQKVQRILNEASKKVFELDGVQPNPRLSLVKEGVNICRRNNIEFILAVGGGSVIDTAKAIAAGYKTDGDIWECFRRKKKITGALPIGTVLTVAGTGSEMNGNMVISNMDIKEKLSLSSQYVFPKFSIIDPSYTFSVSKEQTIYGCIDIISHVFEQYFSKTPNTPLQDRFCEGIIKTVIENTQLIIEDPYNYDARANILLCSTMALNKIIGLGVEQDWASHAIEHELSAIYDIPHGAGLAIICPNWMKYVLTEGVEKFKQFASRIWGIDDNKKTDYEIALEGINKIREFFEAIGAPTTLREVGINDMYFNLMAERVTKSEPKGAYKKLFKEDIAEILKMSL